MRISVAKQMLEALWPIQRAILLIGETGVGKSELIEDLAKKMGYYLISLRLGQQEVGDIIGLPQILDGRTTWAKPAWWPNEGDRAVLFLDELNRATRQVLQAIFQLVLDRRLHTHQLPDSVKLVAAMNPDRAAYDVSPLDPALLTRFIHITIENTPEDFVAWANEQGLHPAVIEFIQSNPGYLEPANGAEPSAGPIPTPRGWEMVSDTMGLLPPADASRKNLLANAITGIVGEDASLRFIEYLEKHLETNRLTTLLKCDMPDLKKATKAFRTSDFAHVADQMLSMTKDLLEIAVEREDRLAKMQLLVRSLPLDVFVHVMTQLAEKAVTLGDKGIPHRRLFEALTRNEIISKRLKDDLLEFWFSEQREKPRSQNRFADRRLRDQARENARASLSRVGVDLDSLYNTHYWENLCETDFKKILKWLRRNNAVRMVRAVLWNRLPARAVERLFEFLPESLLAHFLRFQDVDPVLFVADWERMPPDAREAALACQKIPDEHFPEVALDATYLFLRSRRHARTQQREGMGHPLPFLDNRDEGMSTR